MPYALLSFSGIDPQAEAQLLKKKKMMQEEKREQQLQQRDPTTHHLMTKLKERIKSNLAKGQRRHSCPKCGKAFGKPSHVKRHLFTCRGPTFQRTSPIKNTTAAYYKQIQNAMNNMKNAAAAAAAKSDHHQASSSTSSLTQQRKPLHLPKRQHVSAAATSEAKSRSTQSNFLAFGIESMQDLVTLIPQFLTLEGE